MDKSIRLERHVLWGAAALVPIGLALSAVHPFLAIVTAMPSAIWTFILFDAMSRALFGNKFQPPSRVPGSPDPKWSDWALFVPWVIAFVSVLFLFGEIGNCLSGERFWKGWFVLCS